MTEEKIEIEQTEEFTKNLCDEALDRKGDRLCGCHMTNM